MKIKTKTKLGRVTVWVAAVLAVLTLLGAFAALIPRRDKSPPEFPTFGSDVVLAKLTDLPGVKNGEVTAASYANGMHFAAFDHADADKTLLLASKDGKSWTNVLDHPAVSGVMPYDGIIDEIVYVNDTWFFGFFEFGNAAHGIVFRFRPESGDNSGLGGEWQASFDGKFETGRATSMDVIDGTLYLVTENGHLYRKTKGGAWYAANEAIPTPFAGYRVFDLAKCGDKFLALGEDECGTVLFTASSMTGTWTVQRIDGIKANRFDTTDTACFIACEDGKLVYSSDLSTWKVSRMADNVSFTEFFTFGSKHYAIGSNDTYGVLYESTNGAAWERVASVDEPLSSVSVTASEALLYGNRGGVYRLTK